MSYDVFHADLLVDPHTYMCVYIHTYVPGMMTHHLSSYLVLRTYW